MIILSHRGYWKEVSEKNQKIAFERSFDLGFGTETDVRDCAGKLVISHDIPTGTEMSFEDFLETLAGRNLPLAINIKADGLALQIKEILEKYKHTNYFTFDMSIPDMIFQMKENMKVYTAYSDVVKSPILLENAQGIWLDSFYGNWYEASVIDEIIEQGKKVCIVSADLHKRDTQEQWKIIKKSKYINSDSLMLCTDYPEKAKEYFYEK